MSPTLHLWSVGDMRERAGAGAAEGNVFILHASNLLLSKKCSHIFHTIIKHTHTHTHMRRKEGARKQFPVIATILVNHTHTRTHTYTYTHAHTQLQFSTHLSTRWNINEILKFIVADQRTSGQAPRRETGVRKFGFPLWGLPLSFGWRGTGTGVPWTWDRLGTARNEQLNQKFHSSNLRRRVNKFDSRTSNQIAQLLKIIFHLWLLMY